MEQILEEYDDLFLRNSKNMVRARDFVQEIPFRPDAIYFHESPRRMPPEKREILNTQVQMLLEMGLIEECKSLFASGVVLVKTSDGRDCFCSDYRKLNTITPTVSPL